MSGAASSCGPDAGPSPAITKEELAVQMTLGIDVASRAAHQASLADEAGRFAWSGRRFRTTPANLEQLWESIPAGAPVTVVMEPTRNDPLLSSRWSGQVVRRLLQRSGTDRQAAMNPT
jgi:hypothetical protein